MAVAVHCRELRKTYPGGVEAVRGLDLEIAAGECFGLLGPNGAGKTTTIEILEGLLAPSSGEIEIFGLRWSRDARELRELMGISLQETRLSEKLSVRETVALFAAFYRRPRPVEAVIASLALEEKADTWVGKLSGGQRQRLAVATALVGDPRILFLDEPTTGLDPQSRRQLWQIVEDFQTGGGTVVLTTHYMEEAERLCGRVAIVDQGRIMAEDAPAALIRQYGGEHRVEFGLRSGQLDDALLAELPSVVSVRREIGQTVLYVREPHAAIPALLAVARTQGAALAHLSTQQASLEDVFVNLTGRHLREQ